MSNLRKQVLTPRRSPPSSSSVGTSEIYKLRINIDGDDGDDSVVSGRTGTASDVSRSTVQPPRKTSEVSRTRSRASETAPALHRSSAKSESASFQIIDPPAPRVEDWVEDQRTRTSGRSAVSTRTSTSEAKARSSTPASVVSSSSTAKQPTSTSVLAARFPLPPSTVDERRESSAVSRRSERSVAAVSSSEPKPSPESTTVTRTPVKLSEVIKPVTASSPSAVSSRSKRSAVAEASTVPPGEGGVGGSSSVSERRHTNRETDPGSASGKATKASSMVSGATAATATRTPLPPPSTVRPHGDSTLSSSRSKREVETAPVTSSAVGSTTSIGLNWMFGGDGASNVSGSTAKPSRSSKPPVIEISPDDSASHWGGDESAIGEQREHLQPSAARDASSGNKRSTKKKTTTQLDITVRKDRKSGDYVFEGSVSKPSRKRET